MGGKLIEIIDMRPFETTKPICDTKMTRFPSYSGAGIINYQTTSFCINIANDLERPQVPFICLFGFFHLFFSRSKSWIEGLKTSATDWWQSAFDPSPKSRRAAGAEVPGSHGAWTVSSASITARRHPIYGATAAPQTTWLMTGRVPVTQRPNQHGAEGVEGKLRGR